MQLRSAYCNGQNNSSGAQMITKSANCILCGLLCKSLRGLKNHHTRKHVNRTLEGLFKCSFCQFKFKRMDALRNHESDHNGVNIIRDAQESRDSFVRTTVKQQLLNTVPTSTELTLASNISVSGTSITDGNDNKEIILIKHTSLSNQMCGGNVWYDKMAKNNLVTFHDVNTVQGTIGKITFQFLCNACRGERGVARCRRGRLYCVSCCGHPKCD